ncbi:MAG: hypothetical protein M3443_03360 [Actinomycetota bacterium]|nr:hypothetical protein [Actinomycetota bacterium]
MILGGTFTDIGSPLDVDDRVGFSGLLQALSMPSVNAAVILHSSHLSSRAEIVTSLVAKIRRTGASLWARDGQLPEMAKKHCAGQAEWS